PSWLSDGNALSKLRFRGPERTIGLPFEQGRESQPDPIEGDTSDMSYNLRHPSEPKDSCGIAGCRATDSHARKNKMFLPGCAISLRYGGCEQAGKERMRHPGG